MNRLLDVRHRTFVIYSKYFADLLLFIIAAPVAYILRLESSWLNHADAILIYTMVGLPVKMMSIYFFRLHMQSWRTASLADLFILMKVTVSVIVFMFMTSWFLQTYIMMPLSIPFLEGIIALLLLSSIRLMRRVTYENDILGLTSQESGMKRVLVIGAGKSGTALVKEMFRNPSEGLFPVVFLDDDPGKQNVSIVGLPVAGTIADLETTIFEYDIDLVLISMPTARGEVIRGIVEVCNREGVANKTLPGINSLITGDITISQIRDVDLEDLLRRDPIELQFDLIAGYLKGRTILVTGAGGSIGSEITRQISRFDPDTILLLGRGENSIFNIQNEMIRTRSQIRYVSIITDVRDEVSLRHVFETHRPNVIFHAAAHKHVPLMEANPDQAILNNVGGTRNLANMALEFGVERFVNISSDKAVNPTSIMGASKRAAELMVSEAAQKVKNGQIFVSVRFGNVLGSRGSVIPMFNEQIKRGGPVTVTHEDMTRYFMTIPEASQLVLQAAELGRNGDVYVLDMGEPVRIIDLAEDLIRLSGFEPGHDIRIEVTGIRPGEKLFEELLTAEEGTTSSRHDKIFIARKTDVDPATIAYYYKELIDAAGAGNDKQIRHYLGELIPTFSGSPDNTRNQENTVSKVKSQITAR
jgi:FlaA1/EpsC-like NDP-sugar epimerase